MEWIVCRSCYSGLTIASPDLRPHLGIDRQCTDTPGFGIEEGSMMVQLSVAEEPGMARALDASVWLINGSGRSRASIATQLGNPTE
jgi:hypothetical protein